MEKKKKQGKKIVLGFRFSLNFLRPLSTFNKNSDNRRLEKNLKRLRLLLHALDRLNSRGITVNVAWSIGSSYSLNSILKGLCPDLLEHIKYRVDIGYDEINLSPYNQAILPLLLPNEFSDMFNEAFSNERNNGLQDVFGSCEKLITLPAGIYSPAILQHLQTASIEAISFNVSGLYGRSYSDLTSTLSFSQQYNPIWLGKTGSKYKTTLIPSVSGPDILNHTSLKKWIMGLREKQTKSSKTQDIFLFFDEDLNSNIFFRKGKIDQEAGRCMIEKLINDIIPLSYISFETPSRYLKEHPAKGLLTIDRDILSGEEQTLTPWADKWESKKMWGMIERSRIYSKTALKIAIKAGKKKIIKNCENVIKEAEDHSMLALSESNFGPDFPMSNSDHYKNGFELAHQAEKSAAEAYKTALKTLKKRKRKVCLDSFRESLQSFSSDEISVNSSSIENQYLKIDFRGKNGTFLNFKNNKSGIELKSQFSINYKNVIYKAKGEIEYISTQNGVAQMLVKGKIKLKGELKPIFWQHIYTIYSGSPYLFIDFEINIPILSNPNGLYEIMPAEILISNLKLLSNDVNIWKDSPLDDLEELKFATNFFKNLNRCEILHSQITRSWIAYKTGEQGLLIAQKLSEDCSFSFCPMKIRQYKKEIGLQLNPMGCYQTKKFSHKHLTIRARNFFTQNYHENYSSGPSYNGKSLKASIMLASFENNQLPKQIIKDAVNFSRNIQVPGTKTSELSVTG